MPDGNEWKHSERRKAAGEAWRGVAFSRAAGAGQLDMVAAEICELRKQQQLCS